MKYLACFCLAVAVAVPALAWSTEAPVQLSMTVTGTAVVRSDGSVASYSLDNADQLPEGVRSLLKTTVPAWTFAAVKAAGKPMPAIARMAVHVSGTVTATTKQKVAGKDEEQNTVQIGVAGIDLICPPPHEDLTYANGCDPAANLRPWPADKPLAVPVYPATAVKLQAGGAVHLYMDIDSLGRVMQAAVGRVDLYMEVPHPEELRRRLADATLAATQDWQFSIPTAGPMALARHWVVAKTVKFEMAGDDPASVGHGQWQAYAAGPEQSIPWVGHDAATPVKLPDLLVTAQPLPDPRAERDH